MTELELQDVSLDYGTIRALNRVSVSCARGAFTVVVGPSGCGKSSLLRVIAGLERPTTGTIQLEGSPIIDVPAWNRGVAMVFQSYALYPHLNVFDNLAFPLRRSKISRDALRERVGQMARRMGMEDALARKPATLSGGQRQRVALGRALIREPKVLLLDEPLSNLDAQLRIEMRGEIRRLHRETGTTILYVTHDQEEAMELADTLVVLRDGRVEQCAPPAVVYDAPESEFVAQFFGTPPMNLWPLGRLATEVNLFDGVDLQKLAQRLGPSVNIGIRPEAFHRETDSSNPCTFSGRATSVQRRGRDQLVEIDSHGVGWQALLPPRCPVTEGETILLRAPVEAIHLFDQASGVRIEGAGLDQ